MGLNLSSGGEDYHPYIKYNAKEGRWYIPTEDGPETEVQITKLAMDFPSIQTGWIAFSAAQGPQYVWDRSNVRQPQPPPIGEAKFREGFRLYVFSTDKIKNTMVGLREWNSSAAVVKSVVKIAYETWEQKRPDHLSVPVFIITGLVRVKSNFGTMLGPQFELEKFVPRDKVPGFKDIQLPKQAPEPEPDTPSQQQGSVIQDDDIPF